MNADELRLITRNGALIARPTVEIDLSNAEQLTNRIAEAVTADCHGVVIDLGEVEFLDSFGMYVLIGLSQSLAHQRQSVALVIPPDSPMLGAFRISNVDKHLPIFDGVDQALSALAAVRGGA